MTDKPDEVARKEIMKRMGITEKDFGEYVKKVSKFFDSLNKDEQQFHVRNNGRTIAQIAKSLGPDVAIADVEHVFGSVPRISEICILACCVRTPPPPPHP